MVENMHARSLALTLVLALTALIAAFAPGASAATYCLYAGDCYGVPANVYPATSQGFNDAGSAASSNPGADKIEIGHTPVELTSSVALNATPTNQLAIEGVGGDNSLIHVGMSSGYGLLMSFGGELASGSISNLKLKVDGPASGARLGLDLTGGRASGISVEVDSGPNEVESYGMSIDSGSECLYCSFAVSGDNATGVRSLGDAKFVASEFRDSSGADDSTTGLLKYSSGTTELATSQFVGLKQAISLADGGLSLHDSTINIGAHTNAVGVLVDAAGDTTRTLSATIDGVSIVGTGNDQDGVLVRADTNQVAGEHASASIKNSLLYFEGVPSTPARCEELNLGDGSITIEHTFTLTGSPNNSGCSTSVSNNLASDIYDAADLFVDWSQGDLRLAPDAPVIDEGDPSTLTAGRAVDAFGAQRFVDWPPTGSATIDQGGSEYQNYAPEKPSLTASATTVELGKAIGFGATGSDANGDALSYSWSFGDGEDSTAQNPAHTFTAIGSYLVSVRTYDGEWNSEAAEILVTVVTPVPAATPKPDCCQAGAGSSSFAKASGPFKFKKGAKLKNGFAIRTKKPKGASIKVVTVIFPVTLTLALKTAKGKKLKGSQKVTFPVGTSYMTFGGRWNKKPLPGGSYRLIDIGTNTLATTNPIKVKTPK